MPRLIDLLLDENNEYNINADTILSTSEFEVLQFINPESSSLILEIDIQQNGDINFTSNADEQINLFGKLSGNNFHLNAKSDLCLDADLELTNDLKITGQKIFHTGTIKANTLDIEADNYELSTETKVNSSFKSKCNNLTFENTNFTLPENIDINVKYLTLKSSSITTKNTYSTQSIIIKANNSISVDENSSLSLLQSHILTKLLYNHGIIKLDLSTVIADEFIFRDSVIEVMGSKLSISKKCDLSGQQITICKSELSIPDTLIINPTSLYINKARIIGHKVILNSLLSFVNELIIGTRSLYLMSRNSYSINVINNSTIDAKRFFLYGNYRIDDSKISDNNNYRNYINGELCLINTSFITGSIYFDKNAKVHIFSNSVIQANILKNKGFLDINGSTLKANSFITDKILHVLNSSLISNEFFGEGLIALFNDSKLHANNLNLNTVIHIDNKAKLEIIKECYISAISNIEARESSISLGKTKVSGGIILSYGCNLNASKLEFIYGQLSTKFSTTNAQDIDAKDGRLGFVSSALNVNRKLHNDINSSLHFIDSKADINTLETHGETTGILSDIDDPNTKSTLNINNMITHAYSKTTENSLIINAKKWDDYTPITLTAQHVVFIAVSSSSCAGGVVLLIFFPGNPLAIIPANALIGSGLSGITYCLSTRGRDITFGNYICETTKGAFIGATIGGVVMVGPGNMLINAAINKVSVLPPGMSLNICEKILSVLSSKIITTGIDGAIINLSATGIKSVFYKKIPGFGDIGIAIISGGLSYGLAGYFGLICNEYMVILTNKNLVTTIKILVDTFKGAIKGAGKQFIFNIFDDKNSHKSTYDLTAQTFFNAFLYGLNSTAASFSAEHATVSDDIIEIETETEANSIKVFTAPVAYKSLVKPILNYYTPPPTTTCSDTLFNISAMPKKHYVYR